MHDLQSGGRPVDILINNAGVTVRAPLLQLSVADWQKVIDVDLTSAFLVTRQVASGMMERGRGKVVNICSLMTRLARPTAAAYASAKGGLGMLTRAMCAEWAGKNLQVNGIAPGFIDTDLTKPLVQDPKFDAWVKSRAPAARWGRVEDLVGTCVFLCAPASDFVNGQILFVDGGLTAVL
jgi:gluconate 5-dehydrogenase